MGIKHTEFSKMIFEHIDELFAEQIGPVAPMLCEEALEEWIKEVKSNDQRVGIKVIPLYINKLMAHIDNEAGRQQFKDAVYEIEVLKLYKK